MFLRMFLMDWSLEIVRTLFRYRGIPKNAAKLFFASVDFQKSSFFSFLNIFQKFQKEALDKTRGHLTIIGDFSIFAIFGSKSFEKWNHAACFHFLKFFDPKIEKIKVSLIIVRCPRIFSNTSFWIFWKILRNEKVIRFGNLALAQKSCIHCGDEIGKLVGTELRMSFDPWSVKSCSTV